MRHTTFPDDATLLDILIDGFDKNDVLDGLHWRDLPMPDELSAIRKFTTLVDEARRWKGPPLEVLETAYRRMASWADLELRQAGRGILVRARAPRFYPWWSDLETWAGDPMAALREWIESEPRMELSTARYRNAAVIDVPRS